MEFPSNPEVGQAYSLNGTRWVYDGPLGWYRPFMGRHNELIKIYAPMTAILGHEATIDNLETRLAELESKSFLELE